MSSNYYDMDAAEREWIVSTRLQDGGNFVDTSFEFGGNTYRQTYRVVVSHLTGRVKKVKDSGLSLSKKPGKIGITRRYSRIGFHEHDKDPGTYTLDELLDDVLCSHE